LGIGDWGLGIGPNPQSPIPNPQSPIPNPHVVFALIIYLERVFILNKLDKKKFNKINECNKRVQLSRPYT
jgi:hypothetical protein